jgi:hypothetical protein
VFHSIQQKFEYYTRLRKEKEEEEEEGPGEMFSSYVNHTTVSGLVRVWVRL